MNAHKFPDRDRATLLTKAKAGDIDAAESLVYLTEGITLEPGDILFTGTPSGVGHARKPEPIWMKKGDTVEVEIQGIGVLKNGIEDEK